MDSARPGTRPSGLLPPVRYDDHVLVASLPVQPLLHGALLPPASTPRAPWPSPTTWCHPSGTARSATFASFWRSSPDRQPFYPAIGCPALLWRLQRLPCSHYGRHPFPAGRDSSTGALNGAPSDFRSAWPFLSGTSDTKGSPGPQSTCSPVSAGQPAAVDFLAAFGRPCCSSSLFRPLATAGPAPDLSDMTRCFGAHPSAPFYSSTCSPASAGQPAVDFLAAFGRPWSSSLLF